MFPATGMLARSGLWVGGRSPTWGLNRRIHETVLDELHAPVPEQHSVPETHGHGLAVEPSVAARLQAYARTGDPSTLWPGLTETARVSALQEVERITRAVLAGSAAVHVDPHDVHGTSALLIAGHTSGTGTLLGRWIADGMAVAREDVARGLLEQLAHARRRADRMAREVAPALDALEARGLKPVALRGFHTSRVYFEEPGLRRMADIDLLVPPRLIGRAEAALQAVGFRPTAAVVSPVRGEWIVRTWDTVLVSC